MPIFCWKPSRWLPVSDQKPKPSQRASRCMRAPTHPSSLLKFLQLHFRVLTLLFLPGMPFTPDIQKPSCLQISLPSNLCSNVTFSKEAFLPHFKWRLLALQHSLSLFSASCVSIVLLNLLINFFLIFNIKKFISLKCS